MAWTNLTVMIVTGFYVFQLQQCYDNDRVTIHGLWPEWDQWCDGPNFNPSLLASIQPQLDKWWPSCDDNSTSFHAHEWEKHGTCSGMSELDYFNTALQLRSLYTPNLTTCLWANNISPFPCPNTNYIIS